MHISAAGGCPPLEKWVLRRRPERNAEQLALVGDSLYYSAELGTQEFEGAKFLKETLEGIGFKVETGGAGFPTAAWGTGQRQAAGRNRYGD